MDKLKPLITHKFWIILFIALILPVVGWSMATGSLAKEIDERKTAIDKAFTDAQIQPNPPNETWSSALREINKKKENYIGESNKFVWEKQKELFVWPPEITPLMSDTPYRGEITRVPRNLYRSAYKFEILRAHKAANPFDIKDGTGLVQLSPNTIPHVPLDKWKTLPPTSEEMWNAQEDVWLVTSILEAIAKVNKGAANISESPVRQISVLELRGGTPGDDGSAPAGGDMEGMGGMDPEMMAGGGGMFGGGSGGAGPGAGMDGGRDGTLSIDVDMDLMKIFGNNVDGSAGGGDGDMGGDMSAEGMGMVPGGGMGGGMGGQSQNLKRYYNEEEDLPYKTRAFYLKATIQSSKLPDLLASLSSMPWPTKIVRVQMASMYSDNMQPIVSNAGGGATRGGAMGGSGAAGGFGAESGFGNDNFGLPGAGVSGGFGMEAEAGGVPGSGLQPGAENRSLLEAAMNDPELAVVTIAGLMTLYKPYVPPEGAEVAEQTDGSQQPAGEAGAATEGQPGDPAATDAPATDTPATPGQPAASGLATPGTAPGQPATPPAAQGDTPAEPADGNNSPPAAEPGAGTQPDTPQPSPQNETPAEPAGNQ